VARRRHDGDEAHRGVPRAHEAVDRLADKAIPAVERLRGTYNDAAESLKERADQALDLKDDPQLSQLTQKELFLCQKENMLPAAYLGVKKKVTDHRDDMAHQIRIFNGDAAQAYESVGGIHAPQMNHKGAVLVTKGELRYYSSFWNVDIFRVCKLWQLFREMDIIYDPSYLPATCFGVTQKA